MTWWRTTQEWHGERCFVVAGGPSLADIDLSSLEGGRVICVNSAWRRVPSADLLFFGDDRWWHHYGAEVTAGFAGRVATVATTAVHPRLLYLRRSKPPGLASAPDTVMIRRTSTTAAINLAVHLGVSRICLLGVDNCVDSSGRTHHHAPHPWDLRHGWQDEQRADLESIVSPLRALGVTVVNASPISTLPYWPKVSLTDEAAAIAQRHARAWRQPTSTGFAPPIDGG